MLVLIVGDLHLPLRAANLPLKFRKLLVPGKIQQVICTGNVCDRETWDYLRTVAPDVKGVKGDFDESPHLPQSLVVQHGPIRIGVIHGHQILPAGDKSLLASLAMQMDVDVLLTGATHRFESWERDGRFFVNPGSATGAWAVNWPLFADEEEKKVLSAAESKSETKDTGKESMAEESPTTEAGTSKTTEKTADPKGNQAETASKNTDAATDAKESDSTTDPDTDGKQRPPPQDAEKKPQSEPGKEMSKPKRPQRKPAPPPTPSFVLLDIQGPAIVSYVYQLIGGEVKVEKSEYKKDLEAARDGHSGEIVDASDVTSPGGAVSVSASAVGASIDGPAW